VDTLSQVADAIQTNTTADAEPAVDLQALQAQIDKQSKLIEKFRQQEKTNQEAAKEVGAQTLLDAIAKLREGGAKEAEEWKSKFTKLEDEHKTFSTTVKGKALDSALSEALAKAGAADVKTALKLVQRDSVTIGEDLAVDAESITKAIDALKISDPIMFAQTKLPDIKLSTETGGTDVFKDEVANAHTIDDLRKIAAKYNKQL
jgi:hypothetical protein